MRIVHLGKYCAPYQGRMETVLSNLCETHAGKAEVIALVVNRGRETVEEKRLGVRVIGVGCVGTPFSVPITPPLPRWLRYVQADILVYHEPNPASLLSYLLVRPLASLVIWFHSDIVHQRTFYGACRPLLRLGMKLARVIVVASPNNVRYTPLLQELSAKCCVIPYAIDPKRFDSSPDLQARVTAIRDGSSLPIILFVGRFAVIWAWRTWSRRCVVSVQD